MPSFAVLVNCRTTVTEFSDGSTYTETVCDQLSGGGGGGPTGGGYVGGGSSGGGSTGGGTSQGTIVDVPDNDNNGEPGASCSDPIGVRENHARGDLGSNLYHYTIGSTVRIHYGDGQSELFTFVSRVSSIPAIPIPGTCG